jgi:hypothetical protein
MCRPTSQAEGQSRFWPITSGMNSTSLRRIIDAAVADLGCRTKRCQESVLIRKGYFVGRQFCYEGVRAIWFADEEVVAFYGGDGQLLGTITVQEQVVKRAA